MKKLAVLTLAGALLLGAATVVLAGAPGPNVQAPAAMANTPAGATRGTWDDFFRSPASPQDTSLTRTVVSRMQGWRDPAAPQLPAAGSGLEPGCALCGVTVEARNGYIRLSGKVSSLQQSLVAENIARSTSGAATVINAIVVGK